MLPWGSLAEGLALRAYTFQQVLMTTSLRNIKALFRYPGRLGSLQNGGKCAGIYLHKKSSPYILWGQMMEQTNSFTPPAFKKYSLRMPPSTLHEVCECRCCHIGWVEAVVPASHPCSLPLLCFVPDLWNGRAAWCAQKVSLRNKWNGYLFAKQKQRGKRCNSPVYTHTHICSVSMFQKYSLRARVISAAKWMPVLSQEG